MPRTSDAHAGASQRARCEPSRTIDCWQPVRLLGEGQWTRVFQARPEGSPADGPSDYAIKVLKPDCEGDPAAVRQIQREARVGRAVSSPHLISILSARIDRPPFYVVMPYLDGGTLASLLLKTPPLCVPQALWITRQTAEALRALHTDGWMHADVKPANILVSRLGHATLIDLGFARAFEQGGEPSRALVGTLNYAAPELFIPRRRRDGQSDIYSLGVILYQTLTGRLPFRKDDLCELAVAHLREPPPDPRTLAPTLPAPLVRLLRRMLAKEPLRRPPAQELMTALMELEIETFDQWQPATGEP